MSDLYVSGITACFLVAMYLLGFLSSELIRKRKEVDEIMATIQEVLDVVAATSGSADSIIVLLNGIKQQLADALAQIGGVPAEVQAKIDEVFAIAVANKAKIDEAVSANPV